MSKPMVDIVGEWINALDNTFKATSMASGVISVCDTHWAVVNGFLTIGTTTYTITEVVQDTSITINANLTNASEFEYSLDVPFYLHGTPKQATTDKGKKSEANIKTTPLFYLFEPIRETFNDEMAAVERDVELRVGVLNNYANEQTTENIYDYSLRAMRKLAEDFVEVVKNDTNKVNAEGVTYIFTSYPKYSNQIDNSGGSSNIFNENLSGIDLVLSAPMKRPIECEC